ncbi:MAG: SDR family NAD(P)-dependent oxidoreductase [Luteitalea sp.]|nr:SDR family NAD(P)-dependent oxidoreductase [Luteitalea sp.]
MTRGQQAALSAGALAIGASLLAWGRRSARRIDFRGRSVLITGGSRGLGLLVARQLADEGARITIAARDQAELERAREELSARGAEVRIAVCDVRIRGDAERLVREVVERTGTIDVLINNAGIIKVGPLEHMQVEDFEEAMAVHFWGPLHTMLAAIPVMRRHGSGRIVNVSSIGGRIGVPHLTPYCASKFALAGLSDSMRGELAKDGISVTTVAPGLMRTGSPFNAWFKGNHRDEFAWFAISDSLPLVSIDAVRAASQLIDACRHGDSGLVITWPAKLAILANAVMPDAVALAMNVTNQAVLPGPSSDAGMESHSGWQSMSERAPSTLTKLTERAAAANNEVPR